MAMTMTTMSMLCNIANGGGIMAVGCAVINTYYSIINKWMDCNAMRKRNRFCGISRVVECLYLILDPKIG